MLGRDGYFSMRMTTSLRQLDALGPAARQQLAALQFRPGKRHADFDAKSDPVAADGLAALVVADAGAPRAGFVAVATAFLARWYKLAILVAGLFGAALVMSLRHRRTAAPAKPPRGR